MKNETTCTNCGANLEFDSKDIIDTDYIKCEYCGTLNIVKIKDDSLTSVKNMALHTFKEYKVKNKKEQERKNSKVGKLEDKRTALLVFLAIPIFLGIVVAINMLVALYGATSTKDYIFFTIILILSLAMAVTSIVICFKKFKEYSLQIEQENKKTRK